jgi:hypothetical protein
MAGESTALIGAANLVYVKPNADHNNERKYISNLQQPKSSHTRRRDIRAEKSKKWGDFLSLSPLP